MNLPNEDLRRETNVVFKKEKNGPIFQDQLKNVMEKCSDLENELKYFKDLSCDLKIKLHMCQTEAEENKLNLNELRQKIKHIEANKSRSSDASQNEQPEVLNSRITLEMLRILCEVKNQLQASLFLVLNITNGENCQEILLDSMVSSCRTNWEELTEDILNDIVKLNASLQMKVAEYKVLLQNSENFKGLRGGPIEKIVLHFNPTPEMKLLELEIDEQDISRLDHVDCKSVIVDLKNAISDKQMEDEALKTQHLRKLQEIQHLLSEAPVESQALNRYSTFQSTIECHTGEFIFQKKQSDFLNKDVVAESNLSSLQEQENGNQKRLQMCAEFEKFKQESTQPSRQVSSSQDELERISAHAQNEVSILRLNKNNCERKFQGVPIKEKLYETELFNMIQESDDKIERLMRLLNASRRSEELLTADIEGMQQITNSMKSSEGYFKRIADELEYKLKASDYEKQRMDNDPGLKSHIQKMAQCQCARSEKEEQDKVSCSAERSDPKAEKMIFPDKFTHIHNGLHSDKKSLMKVNSVTKEAVYAPETCMRNVFRRKSVKSGGNIRS